MVDKEPTAEDYSNAKDVKELLDRIGEHIYKKVHRDDANYRGKLHGRLKQAKFSNQDRVQTNNPCRLNYNYDTSVTSTVIDPCKHKSEERFSDTKGSECDDEKIEGSYAGACAPFRRLHICDRNLEQIKPQKITATDNLLVDVCMAAQFEGASISGRYRQYQEKYNDSGHTMCTMLARSFADIGDIIRGKDLYLGYDDKEKKQRENLENKLKEIFKNIYEELRKNGKRKTNDDIEKRYRKDDDPNFYKLREDWWDANRAKIWRAMTCGAGNGDKYFRKSCSDDTADTHEKCRCVNDDPPTYFDYVPQYLRWFEEWGEDFCRKRKKQLENAMKNCRGQDGSGEERYCDLNMYDCKRTAKGEERFVQGDDCYNCSVTCIPFGSWIDNQKKEFEKQKEKYTKEMQKYTNETSKVRTTTKGTSNGPINNLYVKDFYEQLKEDYGTVNKFLQKLSQEKICKDKPREGKEEADHVDFTKDDVGELFSRTKYCRACPWCGLENNKPPWKPKDETKCKKDENKNYKLENITKIPILTPEEGQSGILQKYSKFCANGDNKEIQIKEWQCYYDEDKQDSEQNNNCVEGEWGNFKQGKTFRSYNSFFWIWVYHMLHDSVDWKKELKNCINNTNGKAIKCRDRCNTDCKCYKKWIEQKQTEWSKIKEHFKKQGDILLQTGTDPIKTLEYVLKGGDLLENIKDVHGDTEDIKHIEKLLEDEKAAAPGGASTEQKSIIDELFNHELQEAKKCLDTHKDDTCPEDTSSFARAENNEENDSPPRRDLPRNEFKDEDKELSEEEEEEENLEGDGEQDTTEDQDGSEDTTEETETTVTTNKSIDVCNIVKKVFEDDDNKALQEACGLKYGPKTPTSWRCIPTGNTNRDATSEGQGGSDGGGENEAGRPGGRFRRASGEPGGPSVAKSSGPSDSNQGGICIPPRRRKLYIKKIVEWATKYGGNTQEGETSQEGSGDSGSSVSSSQDTGTSGEQGAKGDVGDGNQKGQEAQQTSNGQNTSESSVPAALQSSVPTTESNSNPPQAKTPSRTTDVDPLLAAFVESAAVETFFLWDRYKKEWEQRNRQSQEGLLPQIPLASAVGVPGVSVPGAGIPVVPGAGILPGVGGYPGPDGESRGLNWTQGFTGATITNAHEEGTSQNGLLDNQLKGNPGPNGLQLPSLDSENPSDPNDPAQLQLGVIPPPFLRQMFYTIADYRDILVHGGTGDTNGDTKDSSVSSNNNNNIVVLASGNTEKEKKEMEKIQQQLKAFFSNSGDKTKPSDTRGSPSRTPPGHQPSTSGSSSGENPQQTWWSDNAPHIWKAMICALTYEEKNGDGRKGPDGTTTLKQDEKVKKNLYDENTKTGGKYHYNKVALKNEEQNGAKPYISGDSTVGNSPLSPSNGTTLAEFVTRPAYFRWLEEWGTEFCGMRARLLKDVKKACREKHGGGDTFCSGHGNICDETKAKSENTFIDLHCKDCLKECRKYKNWIEKKFEEYYKQQKIYGSEHGKLKKDNSSDGCDNKDFFEQIKEKNTAASFLKELKHCKHGETGEEKDEEYDKNKIDFNNSDQTFSPSTYCKACPIYGVTCNSLTRGRSATNGCSQNGSPNATTSADGEQSVIEILINDGSTNGTTKDNYQELKECSKKYNLFKGLREQQWKCQKKYGVDQCNLTNFSGNIDFDKDIWFSEFFQRWLRYFIYDYNKLKHKIDLCIKNEDGKEHKCITGCKEKCECVEEWLNKKSTEWEDIKKHYKKHSETSEQSIAYRVRTYFLEQGPFTDDANKAKKVVQCKEEQDKLWGCTGPNNCTDTEKQENKDFITNLIDKLKEKIDKCKIQHEEQTKTDCESPSTTPQTLEDEDEQLEEETEVKAPNICDEVLKKTETVKEDNECKTDAPQPDVKEEEEGKETSTSSAEGSGEPQVPVPASSTESTEELPSAPPAPAKPTDPKSKQQEPRRIKTRETRPPPQREFTSSDWRDVMSASAFPWTVGVAFVALTYWFLKKKTKSSVDLLRVLQIPQNDYGMPTKTSPNRYIPYKSAQYRGKRYIYLEGDSGTDSGYTDHYSDITSSSESEYEELDINDIYPYQSPKYKTLIEVVLEPSKRDTQSGNIQNDIPNDIQNDIQNDDIPSNKITDIEWNELKQNFISNMLQNEQPNDLPNNNYTSGTTPTNTNNTTTSHDNVDNNTHPTPSRHTLDQKPFIMSIHDRNLYTGEEYNYDMTTNSDNNDLYSGQNNLYSDIDPTSSKNDVYSGIDLINDSLSGGNHDIYDELLKRKENELFGTNHVKHTTTNRFAKPTNSDPITNQRNLFHKWLDGHRDMCEKWDKNNKVDILNQLKEEWENDNNNSGNLNSGNTPPTSDNTPPNSDIPSGKLSDIHSGKLSDIPSDNNIHSDIHPSDIPSGKLSDIPSSNKTLNTDVYIQIDMDNPKHINEFTYVDSNPNQVENQNPNLTLPSNPNFVENINPNLVENITPNITLSSNPNLVGNNINPVDETPTNNPNHVQIQMSVKNTQIVEKKFPIGDVWGI
ncbi:erythrocyte membrane protein 1, PfEMP1, putative [Plasmodium reichenowi]|uniref:Erythrocyte membrane protein 1, PfEMP1, putative n=1 Tax=Plasmodium reichenowi TaxID=5854 RepID=A0A2P9DCC3_PLARE|nr:erythrocyte membrane protein 1, PfEMP1, putative [Plasmodium reichenowi]